MMNSSNPHQNRQIRYKSHLKMLRNLSSLINFDTSLIIAALVESHPMHVRAFSWLKKAKAKDFERSWPIEREIGSAIFEYQGQRGDSLVIFGEEGDSPLIGATTLVGFGLVLDPFRRELIVMR